MKAIKLGCKTAGFQFGDTVEVGTGKGQIASKDAKSLIGAGQATEVVDKITPAKNEALAKTVAALEAKVTELETANGTLTEDKAALEAKVTELETALKAKK